MRIDHYHHLCDGPRAPRASISVVAVRGLSDPHPLPGANPMGLTLTNTQGATLHFHDLDAKGRDVGPTDLAQPPAWTATPNGQVVLTPAADGMSVFVAPASPGATAGDATVAAAATTKEGVALATSFALTFTANPAAAASITADTPVELPAAAAPAA